MEWADATITRLRQFWHEGHSTAEIGRRLGVSKNSVVGKVHRLDLPARPSPIVRDPNIPPRQYPARRAPGSTLTPLASVTAPSAPRPDFRVATCCWPIGEPGTRGFTFCGKLSVTGKPYCEACCGMAYIRVRHRHEDVDAT